MSNTTKLALEASLKKLLRQKPFDKITIADLTEDCGISRMAFYYHFKDIYDLVEWACLPIPLKILNRKFKLKNLIKTGGMIKILSFRFFL